MKKFFKKENAAAIGFVGPAVLILAALIVYPVCYGIYISFFKTNLVNQWDFVGLDNYVSIFKNATFTNSLWKTLIFTVCVVTGHVLLGFIFSTLLNQEFKGRTFFRAVLMLPWLFPEVVVAILFKWILNPMNGLINGVLLKLGLINDRISILSNPRAAFMAVIFMSIWKGFPLVMTQILAGLQAISRDLYEAAIIDGCNKWQQFRYVTLPGLKNVLMVTLILDTVWWFKQYTIISLMTGGGPNNATSIVSVSVYKQAFEFFHFGPAAAMSVVILIICMAIGLIYRRVLNREE